MSQKIFDYENQTLVKTKTFINNKRIFEVVEIKVSSNYFNIKDTLECGQIFRFCPYKKGYMVYSKDKCAYLFGDQENTIIRTLDADAEYFKHFFDLERDYSLIVKDGLNSGVQILERSAKIGQGIRILNQDKTETLFSFMISQNNNIPRIKGIIEKLCNAIGEKKEFDGQSYFAFPTVQKMTEMPLEFYQSIGLGYRAKYLKSLAEELANGLDLNYFDKLSTKQLKKQLTAIYGVGPKVADCVSLFGYHRSDSFPVDTWIDKVYKQDFNGSLTDRNKISDWFVSEFSSNAGYFQQYLFYYKRSKEDKK